MCLLFLGRSDLFITPARHMVMYAFKCGEGCSLPPGYMYACVLIFNDSVGGVKVTGACGYIYSGVYYIYTGVFVFGPAFLRGDSIFDRAFF